MIIYGENLRILQSFHVSLPLDESRVANNDVLNSVSRELHQYFNHDIKKQLAVMPDIPEEFMHVEVQDTVYRSLTREVIMRFNPAANLEYISVSFLEHLEMAPYSIPKDMQEIEVIHLKDPLHYNKASTPGEVVPTYTDTYRPWGFNLATGDFVWKLVGR